MEYNKIKSSLWLPRLHAHSPSLLRALPLSLFFHLSLRLFSQSLTLSRIFSFRNSVFLPVSVYLSWFFPSILQAVSICGCGGNEGKQGDKGAPLSPDPWCCPSPPLTESGSRVLSEEGSPSLQSWFN